VTPQPHQPLRPQHRRLLLQPPRHARTHCHWQHLGLPMLLLLLLLLLVWLGLG
jgi:hypothetical protein